MDPNSSKKFFETKTILAFILTFAVFILWQNHMKSKYPHIYDDSKKTSELDNNKKAKLSEINTPSQKARVRNNQSDVKVSGEIKASEESSRRTKPVQLYTFSNEDWSVTVSNYGLEIKDIDIEEYKQRNLSNVHFKDVLGTSLFGSNQLIDFEVSQKENRIIGFYKTADFSLTQTLKFGRLPYTIDISYETSGRFPGLSNKIKLPINTNIKSSWLMPTFEKQEYVAQYSGEESRDHLTLTDFENQSFARVSMIALGSQFFSRALVDESSLKPTALVFIDRSKKEAVARLDYEILPSMKSFKIVQKFFAGPKDDSLLLNVDKSLGSLINFGYFKLLSYPMLKVLKFFYSFTGNYGLAIILLTLIMRLLVFPIAYRGYKSMSEMQKIQPLLKSIREKHKEDPQKANLETMALMKEKKVNPIGGCLPMLLQFPIFLAFYRMLSESIVFYQAPFVFLDSRFKSEGSLLCSAGSNGCDHVFSAKIDPICYGPYAEESYDDHSFNFSFIYDFTT